MRLRSFPIWLLASSLLFVACRKESSAPDAGTADPTSTEALAKAVQDTVKRLESQPARWTARHGFGGGRTLEVSILQVPEGSRRIEFTAIGRDGSRGLLARIIEKGGDWYVTEADTSAVYRPYMAPLQIPGLYLYLARSELQFFHAEGRPVLGELMETEKNVARFRAALPEGLDAQLTQMAAAAEAADAGSAAADARAFVKDGLQTRIDLATGVIVRAGLPGSETEIDGPHFLAVAPSAESFDTTDLVPGLLASSVQSVTESLVMIAHCGAWRPGSGGCDLDTHLLELNHGALRRVPYIGGTSLPGAFLPGRTQVVVSGTDVAGGMRPMRIDLLTGAQRPLGGQALAQGVSLFPTLSPDETTLAVTWLPSLGARSEARVMLFDLEGGEARPLGEAIEHSHVQWLPDGSGLLLVLREPGAEGAASEPVLARLLLDGTVQRLRAGDQPVILGADALLFFDRSASAWMRAKLDGSAARRFGGGHPGLSHPTLAPDGKQLVFLQRGEDGSTIPVRVDIEGRKATPLAPDQGLWAWPRWK